MQSARGPPPASLAPALRVARRPSERYARPTAPCSAAWQLDGSDGSMATAAAAEARSAARLPGASRAARPARLQPRSRLPCALCAARAIDVRGLQHRAVQRRSWSALIDRWLRRLLPKRARLHGCTAQHVRPVQPATSLARACLARCAPPERAMCAAYSTVLCSRPSQTAPPRPPDTVTKGTSAASQPPQARGSRLTAHSLGRRHRPPSTNQQVPRIRLAGECTRLCTRPQRPTLSLDAQAAFLISQ